MLENNSDCPAGPLFTQRLDALVDQAIAPALGQLGLATRALPGDAAGAVLRVLVDGYRAWGGRAERPRIGVLQLAGRGNVESDEMAAELRGLGVAAAVIDPRAVRFTAVRFAPDRIYRFQFVAPSQYAQGLWPEFGKVTGSFRRLTPQEAATAKIPHVLASVNNDFLHGFSEREWRQLRKLVERMTANGQALQAQEEAA